MDDNDGCFWMSYTDFLKYYQQVTIAQSTHTKDSSSRCMCP